MYFDLSIFSSKRVQTAAQMLIYSVARDITLFASLNSIPCECTTNGELCQLVGAFNSNSLKSVKPYNHDITVDWDFFEKEKGYTDIITLAKNQSFAEHRALIISIT